MNTKYKHDMKVVCINNDTYSNSSYNLIVGKCYDTISYDELASGVIDLKYYRIKNNSGEYLIYEKTKFITLSEFRKRKLIEINEGRHEK